MPGRMDDGAASCVPPGGGRPRQIRKPLWAAGSDRRIQCPTRDSSNAPQMLGPPAAPLLVPTPLGPASEIV